MKLNFIFKSSSIYLLGDVINKALSLILLPFFTSKLQPQDYGIIDTFSILQLILVIIVSFELNQSMIRFAPSSTTNEKRIIYSTSIGFVSMMLAFTSIFLIGFSSTISELIQNDLNQYIYYLGLLNIIISIINSNFLIVSRIEFKPKIVLWASLANGIITSLLAYILVITLNMGLNGYFIAMVSGNSASLLFLILGNYRFIKLSLFSYLKLKELLLFSTPLIPASLGVFLTLYTDRVIIKEHFSNNELGLFGVAYRFSLVSTIILGSYLSSIGPLIFKEFKQTDFLNKLHNYLLVYVLLGVVILCGFSLFSKEGVLLLTSNKAFYKSGEFIYLLGLNSVLFNLYIFFPSLSIAKKTGIISLINISGAILNLVLIFIAIEYIGIFGILLSTIVSTIYIQLMTYQFGKKYQNLKIPFKSKPILILLLAIIITGTFNYIDLFLLNFEFDPVVLVLKLALFSFVLFYAYKSILTINQKSFD